MIICHAKMPNQTRHGRTTIACMEVISMASRRSFDATALTGSGSAGAHYKPLNFAYECYCTELPRRVGEVENR